MLYIPMIHKHELGDLLSLKPTLSRKLYSTLSLCSLTVPMDYSFKSLDNYLPIKLLVTIRTDFSNEVLVPDGERFYTNCSVIYPNKHSLGDLAMLSAKSLIDKYFDCGDNLLSVIQRTVFYPVGALVYDFQVYVYVNVVIDHTLKTDKIFKTRGCHFEKIADIEPSISLEEELKNGLIIVKSSDSFRRVGEKSYYEGKVKYV